MTTELNQSADALAAINAFADAFCNHGTANKTNFDPAAVGQRSLNHRETLRQVSGITGALNLANELLAARGDADAPDLVRNDCLIGALLTTCTLAVSKVYDSVVFVVDEDDNDMPVRRANEPQVGRRPPGPLRQGALPLGPDVRNPRCDEHRGLQGYTATASAETATR